jgi:hypothetical protein
VKNAGRKNAGGTARPGTQGTGSSTPGAGGALEMRACSACAGDYEDPDRTAWAPGEVEDSEFDGAPGATEEEFPAEE